jgi:hypothetical protein
VLPTRPSLPKQGPLDTFASSSLAWIDASIRPDALECRSDYRHRSFDGDGRNLYVQCDGY